MHAAIDGGKSSVLIQIFLSFPHQNKAELKTAGISNSYIRELLRVDIPTRKPDQTK